MDGALLSLLVEWRMGESRASGHRRGKSGRFNYSHF
jgi:hypothetical protein